MNFVKFTSLSFALFFVWGYSVFAQSTSLSLEDLTVNRTFVPEGAPEMVHLNDGTSYAAVADSGKSITQYDLVTGNKIRKILDLSKFPELKISKIEGFEVSADDRTILLYSDKHKIYRRSFTANYFTYNLSTHELLPLSDKKGIRAAAMSNDGYLVAFEWKNNLYLKKLRFGTESAITTDGAKDSVINGHADWLYEEELGMTRAFEWNSTGTDLAFIRFDESQVKSYSLELSNVNGQTEDFYPSVSTVKYPKAGEANSMVSVHVFNVASKTVKTMNVGANTDIYIPRIVWTSLPDKLGVVRMNRLQNQFDLLVFNSASGVASTLYSENSSTYIDPDLAQTITFLPDNKGVLFASEVDGFRHIYHYNSNGIKQAQITSGKWDVTDFYGYNPLKKEVYYQAAEVSPLQREVYAVSLDGKSKRMLSFDAGTNQAVFSKTFGHYILNHSSIKEPNSYKLFVNGGKLVRLVQENEAVKQLFNQSTSLRKEFISVDNGKGVKLNGWLVKPENYYPEQKYPLVMMQYSGPNSQEVLDQWEVGWEYYLAAQGFVVACVDGRGTGARGRDFRTSTYPFLGKFETEDQVAAANYLSQNYAVDSERMAIWGWSFGGFMACNALTNGNGTFKVGIAVAPVTNWKFYDTLYAERFLKRPRDNERGYLLNSPYYQAQNLQGRLFVIHGTIDDNVHFQNLTEYANRLIEQNKQFDMFVYPQCNHSINRGNSRFHLYTMMTQYLIKNL